MEQSFSQDGVSGTSLEILAEFEVSDTTEEFGLKVFVGTTCHTDITYSTNKQTLSVDRSQSGEVDFHEDFIKVQTLDSKLVNGKLTLHIFLDSSCVEVFANEGSDVISSLVFPPPGSEGVHVFSTGGEVKVNMTIYSLSSIWEEVTDQNS